MTSPLIPQPGDLAYPKNRTMGPFPVAHVDATAQTVQLHIGPHPSGPLPMKDFTFVTATGLAKDTQ